MIHKASWLVLMGVLACAVVTVGLAQETPKAVTLEVTDQPVAAVAAQLSALFGVQIGVTAPCEAKVTLQLKDAKLEEAVKAFAESFQASWARAYVLESQPPATPYTADQLVAGLQNQRESWFESMTEEQRNELMNKWRSTFRPPGGQPQEGQQVQPPPVMPGAGRSALGRRGPGGGPGGPGGEAPRPGATPAAPPGAGGQPAAGGAPAEGGPPGQGRGQGGGFGRGLYDPVGQIILPVRTDTVVLEVAGKPLPQALFEVTTASGFLVAATPDLTGTVTLKADNKPTDEIVGEVAKAVNAQWRPIYVLSLPRELSEAEGEQMREQQFQSRWARYWAKPPEERAKEIQERVQQINRWAEAARQPGRDGQPNRAQRGLQRMAPRMMQRMAKYSAGLTPEQRMELKPLLKALGAAVNGPPAQ